MTEEYNWKKNFYDEGYNPAISVIRGSCRWIILNYPDFSFVFGFKRWLINLIMILGISALLMHLMISGTGFLQFMFYMFVGSFVASLFFMRMVALAVLKTVDQYQDFLKENFK